MAPKDEQELRDMLATAFTLDGPCAIRYPRGNGLGIEASEPKSLPVGKGEIVCEGDAGLVISVGTRFADAKAAVDVLKNEDNRSFRLLNLRFIKPLDTSLIVEYLLSSKPLIVIEEGVAEGGVGEAIAVLALKHGWSGAFKHMAMPDSFPEHGTQAEILRDLQLDEAAIIETLRNI